MDERKKPVNGTFTQVPNVFFDTCALPETAQILYLRLLRKIGYKGGKFTGSIRDLSRFVRMSKGTVDRMSRKLKDAGLINIDREEGEAMVITVNTDELWNLNRQHYNHPVPNWDSKLPELSQFGTKLSQNETELSQIESEPSQSGTDLSSDDASNTTNKTYKTENTEVDPSSSQNKKPIGASYLEMCIKELLLTTGEYWKRREHSQKLQKIYIQCDIDSEEVFKSKVRSVAFEARQNGQDMEYFYRCLERAIKSST